MGTAVSEIELQVADLARSVAELSRRVAALEGRAAPAAAFTAPASLPLSATPRPAPAATPAAADLTTVTALVGRTLLAFGGAYLLRALTAAGLLPQGVGVLLALLYAVGWLAFADRAGRAGRPTSAAFHGGTAVLIGCPLLWEATARFHYVGPVASGVAVALFAALALALAWRWRLPLLAWAAGLGAAATAFALVAATRSWVPFTADLVLLGVAGALLAYGRGWRTLGWALAAAAHLGVLLLLVGVFLGSGPTPAAGIGLGLALALSLLGLATAHALGALGRGGRAVTLFEGLLGAASFLVGYVGAGLAAGGASRALVGALGLLLGLGCYGLAFFVVDRAERRTLLFTSTLGLGFLLAGSALLLASTGAGAALAVAWSVLAILAAVGGVRRRRVTLSLHAAVYAAAAAAASGLAAAAAYAFAAPADVAWPPLATAAWAALAAAAVCAALPVPLPGPFWGPYQSATRLLRLAVFVFGAAGVILYLFAPALAGRPGSTVDPGLLATARTAVLAAAALLLGWAARWERSREAAWLVYPVLALAGIKLVVEDFPQGRPATLFVALALCGVALLFAPRLAKRAPESTSP